MLIAVYTNKMGHVNLGIVNSLRGNMAEVIWDRYDDLINYLRDNKKRMGGLSMDVRISWVCTEPNPYVPSNNVTVILETEEPPTFIDDRLNLAAQTNGVEILYNTILDQEYKP